MTVPPVPGAPGAEPIASLAADLGGVDHATAPGDEPASWVEMLLRTDRIEDFLSELTLRVVGEVDTGLSCGISVHGIPVSRLLAASSDEFARRMEQIQYELGDGPGRAWLRGNVVVEVSDIVNDPRWPLFRERGGAENAGACLAIPLNVGRHVVGSLNVYTRHPEAVSIADRSRAQKLAQRAAGAVALASRLVEHQERIRHLQAALTSRSAIDHAVGILMGRHRVTSSAAFDLLRQASQHTNVKLRDVAVRLIIDTTGQPPQPRDPGSA